jgi:hypothetical protein
MINLVESLTKFAELSQTLFFGNVRGTSQSDQPQSAPELHKPHKERGLS